MPAGTVMGSAIDHLSGSYFAYGDYGGSNFYRYDRTSNTWSTITFPFSSINDGGMAYVSTPGLQGTYAVEGEGRTGFSRYLTFELSAEESVTTAASASTATVGSEITARICLTLRRGTYHARATKSGFRSAGATVTVRAAVWRQTSHFTG